MVDSGASGRYAHALFGLAKEKGQLDQVGKEFIEVIRLIDQHKEISHLVLNSTISRAEVEDFIGKASPILFKNANS